MTFIDSIKQRIGKIGNRLSHIGKSEPLSIMSLILIGILDIFVFTTILNGTSEQVKQLTSPDEFIPPICQNIVIHDRWVEDNYIGNISSYALGSIYAAYYPEPEPQTHPICQPVIKALTAVQSDKSLTDLFRERRKLKQKYDSYDLYQKQTFPEAHQIQTSIRDLEKRIAARPEIKSLLSVIESSREKADELSESLRWAHDTYPLKRFGMEMMFLLPLFLLLYIWNSFSISRNRPVQTLLSSHMLVVTFIPIVISFGDLLLDIIPKRFLEKFMAFLASLNLIGIWYYIVIALAVFASMLVIYLIQKKWFTHERLINKRLSKGQCIDCGTKMPAGLSHCPYCGHSQVATCAHCHDKTLAGAEFCTSCGERQAQEQ